MTSPKGFALSARWLQPRASAVGKSTGKMIRVNDKFDVEWREGMTVNSILEVLKFTFPMIIVSVNGRVVPRSEYGTTRIEDNDEVKVIHLIAGG